MSRIPPPQKPGDTTSYLRRPPSSPTQGRSTAPPAGRIPVGHSQTRFIPIFNHQIHKDIISTLKKFKRLRPPISPHGKKDAFVGLVSSLTILGTGLGMFLQGRTFSGFEALGLLVMLGFSMALGIMYKVQRLFQKKNLPMGQHRIDKNQFETSLRQPLEAYVSLSESIIPLLTGDHLPPLSPYELQYQSLLEFQQAYQEMRSRPYFSAEGLAYWYKKRP